MPCSGCGGAGAAESAFCIPASQDLPNKVAANVEAFQNQLQSMYDKDIITVEQWNLMHELGMRHPPVILTVCNMDRRPQPRLWFNYHAPRGRTCGSFLQVRK